MSTHKLICQKKLQQSRIWVSNIRKTQVLKFSIFCPNELQYSKYDMLYVHNNTINNAQEKISENKQESRDSGTKLHKSKIMIWTQQAMFHKFNSRKHQDQEPNGSDTNWRK